jgi:hypothetical protein
LELKEAALVAPSTLLCVARAGEGTGIAPKLVQRRPKLAPASDLTSGIERPVRVAGLSSRPKSATAAASAGQKALETTLQRNQRLP